MRFESHTNSLANAQLCRVSLVDLSLRHHGIEGRDFQYTRGAPRAIADLVLLAAPFSAVDDGPGLLGGDVHGCNVAAQPLYFLLCNANATL